jgi:acyl-coenzyme A thioesterase PaaI-like protein
MSSNLILSAWQRMSAVPLGAVAFSRLMSVRVPYFASISPRMVTLKPGLCVAEMKKRRSVTNHLGTVHAIAMCNLAEVTAGLMSEVSTPPTHRWIPKGMTVEYVKKAETDLRAVAECDPLPEFGAAFEWPISVLVYDRQSQIVLRALITMWITPKR